MIEKAVITCPQCSKEVPNTDFCLYCGTRLRGKVIVPRLAEMERNVLKFLKDRDEAAAISDIHEAVDGSRETVRNMLSNLVKFGLVNRPSRGRYVISEKGRQIMGGET